MAIIKCSQCGFENDASSEKCEICDYILKTVSVPDVPVQSLVKPVVQATNSNENFEYFVICPESNSRTTVQNESVNSYFCNGCGRNHDIDGFLWNIEKVLKQADEAASGGVQTQKCAPKGDNLWFEELNTHFRIDIDKDGGTLGRYGKYGAKFFQDNRYLKVSGDHCMITYEFGNWVLRHISKTNQTKYNNMILSPNDPNLLEDGKILTLAETVSFIVRIG